MAPRTAPCRPSAAAPAPEDRHVGSRIRALRNARGWSLSEAAERLGIGRSTLTKVEADHMSPTIGLLQKIARGFGTDVPALLAERERVPAAGRRAVTLAGEGERTESEHHVHEVLCGELCAKRMVPMKTRIKARPDGGEATWFRHEGEEFVHVLEGRVVFMSEFYAPTTLGPGDSIYLDGTMRHRMVAADGADAVVLFIVAE